jgi:carbamoyl-phosphate synthase large subunit
MGADRRANVLLTISGRKPYLVPILRRSARAGTIAAVDADPSATIRSFADRFREVPSVADEASYVSALLECAEAWSIDAVLPQNDIDLAPLARASEAFAERGVRVLGASAEVVDAMGDKLAAARFFESHSIPHVPTVLAPGEPPSYPAIAKPRVGQGSVGLVRGLGPRDVSALAPTLVVQPELAGEEHHLDILRTAAGTVVSVVPKRKLAMLHGSTDRAVSVRSERLVELGVALGAALGHVGSVDVDVMMTSDGPAVLDVNLRLGGGFPMTAEACPRYVDALLAIAVGEEPLPFLGDYAIGVEVHRHPAFAVVARNG